MYKWISILALLVSVNLQADVKVLVFAGSLQRDSVNKKLAIEAAYFAKEGGASVKVINLEDYIAPIYDADIEKKEKMTANARKLRDLMIQNQVIIIASPEYNGSVSAALKNAIDWASRSEQGVPSREAFKGKRFVIISASPGLSGGARGLNHLRDILHNLGAFVMEQQVNIPDAYNAFNGNGHLKNVSTRNDLKHLIDESLNSQ